MLRPVRGQPDSCRVRRRGWDGAVVSDPWRGRGRVVRLVVDTGHSVVVGLSGAEFYGAFGPPTTGTRARRVESSLRLCRSVGALGRERADRFGAEPTTERPAGRDPP